jgi:dehydrogenase/reductase SDR family member 12
VTVLRSREAIHVSLPVEEAFAHVRDLRNATWDPRVEAAGKVSPGPIGVGTRFVLVARLLGMRLSLPYVIAVHEPPHRLVFTGERLGLAWRDEIHFGPAAGGARIDYDARLELPLSLSLATPAAARLFRRIGQDACEGLRVALERMRQPGGRVAVCSQGA